MATRQVRIKAPTVKKTSMPGMIGRGQDQTMGLLYLREAIKNEFDRAKDEFRKQQSMSALPQGSIVSELRDPTTGAMYQSPEGISKRKFTQDEIRTMGTSDAWEHHKSYILGEMVNDPKGFEKSFIKATIDIPVLTFGKFQKGNILGYPTTAGDELSINLQRAFDDMSDRLLRLRSGAQINEQEFQRLRGLLPTWRDITVKVGKGGVSYPTIRKSLDDFGTELYVAKQRAIQGGFYEPDFWGEGYQKEEPVTASPIPGMTSPQKQVSQNLDQVDPFEKYGS